MFLFVVTASCVSCESVYVLLRFRICLQRLEEFGLPEMVLRSCFHVLSCSCQLSSCVFFVQSLCAVDDIRCGALVPQMVP